MKTLDGKVALVTGSSKGLGKTIVEELAKRGAKVIVNFAKNAEPANNVVKMINEFGGTAIAIKCDVTDQISINQMKEEIKSYYGQSVDILVNNATGPQPELSLDEVTWEDYLNQLNFFVKAPLLLTKAVKDDMRINKWGRIINIGSEVVQLGNANFSNYVTAKSAMLGMTRSWASELGKDGILVNMVNPGFIPVERHGEVTDQDAQGYLSGTPLNHLGQPIDIAEAVAFLASDQAKFITGQSLSVNGGKTFGI